MWERGGGGCNGGHDASFLDGSIMLVAVPLPLNISIPRVSCQEERNLVDDGSAIAAM